jgi:20S proteasome subunit alpha 3
MEAISHAGACLGILATDGVVLAAEKKILSKLLDQETATEKMYKIDDHIACAVAGITSDANILINNARLTAQRHKLTYQEQVPVETLISALCDLKQGYTQFGGLRPFGVSFLYAGWDVHYGFQLYHSDPSGNYGAWKATAIGANNAASQSILKQEWTDTMDVAGAMQLAIKIMSKTMDSSTLTSEKLEFATITRDASGKVQYSLVAKERLDALLEEYRKQAETAELD